MKTIYESMHDGVIGRIIEPNCLDASRPYAEQLEVRIGVDATGARLSPNEFEPLARLVVLELRDYILTNYPDLGGASPANLKTPHPK
jgi:hypothetical protein